ELTRGTTTRPGAPACTDVAKGDPDSTLDDGAMVSRVASPGVRSTRNGAAQCRPQPGGLTTWTLAVDGLVPVSTTKSWVVLFVEPLPAGRYVLVDGGEAGSIDSTGAPTVERSMP